MNIHVPKHFINTDRKTRAATEPLAIHGQTTHYIRIIQVYNAFPKEK